MPRQRLPTRGRWGAWPCPWRWAVTCVGIDVEAGRDAVSVHDAVLDLPVHAQVSVLGLDPQHACARRLVFQHHGVLTVVVTLWKQAEVRSGRRPCQGCFWSPLTSGKTGLLLLTSLMPTMTWAELLSGNGPPDALSSVAVMLRMYWGPLSLGGGLLLSLMTPTHKHQAGNRASSLQTRAGRPRSLKGHVGV